MAKTQALAKELGISADVYFTGRCERVADLLAVSDVCVLSSKAEGFSNSILEYMAASRPVVATDVGGAREAIIDGRTGFIVSPGDGTAMAVRLIELLQDPAKAREMGEQGRRIALENFSIDAQVSATEEIYDRLLAEAKAADRKTAAAARSKV
jgi:glycosyltransferase involved in cell wall biosynthesis